MWSICKSRSILALLCLVSARRSEALSFVEIVGSQFKGQFRYEVQRSKEDCLTECFLYEDCVVADLDTAGVCSLYAAGNDIVPKNGEAYEIMRASSFNSCQPKMVFPTPLQFTPAVPYHTEGTTADWFCDILTVHCCVNPQGVHFYIPCGTVDMPYNLKKVCEIGFTAGPASGCSSTSVYGLRSYRRLLFGDGYQNSGAYLSFHAVTSSAACRSSNSPACERSTILREYRNTTTEDYLYLPEGIVDPTLQYTNSQFPIHVYDTDCTSISTNTFGDCLSDCGNMIPVQGPVLAAP